MRLIKLEIIGEKDKNQKKKKKSKSHALHGFKYKLIKKYNFIFKISKMNYYYLIESKNHATCVCIYMHEKNINLIFRKNS